MTVPIDSEDITQEEFTVPADGFFDVQLHVSRRDLPDATGADTSHLADAVPVVILSLIHI